MSSMPGGIYVRTLRKNQHHHHIAQKRHRVTDTHEYICRTTDQQPPTHTAPPPLHIGHWTSHDP